MRLFAALCLLPLSLLADGTQGWYQHNLWVRLDERWSVGNYLDLRLEDGLRETHTWIASRRSTRTRRPGPTGSGSRSR